MESKNVEEFKALRFASCSQEARSEWIGELRRNKEVVEYEHVCHFEAVA